MVVQLGMTCRVNWVKSKVIRIYREMNICRIKVEEEIVEVFMGDD